MVAAVYYQFLYFHTKYKKKKNEMTNGCQTLSELQLTQ